MATTDTTTNDVLTEEPSTSADRPSMLTPLRAHYLKKSLMQLQFRHELQAMSANGANLSFLGSPFAPPPKDAPRIDIPFLKFIFRQFVLTFPFMAAAPKDFYSDKLQPFMAAVLSRNLSPNSVLDDNLDGTDSEQATRLKVLVKMERNLSMFLGNATKLVEQEEVVRLSQKDLDRLEMLARKRQAKRVATKNVFEVNIVGVRTVTDKGRMRSRVHEEFIIRTRRSHCPDAFVSRRYGDFRTLADELRKAHPEEPIPPPPAKDRKTVAAPTAPPSHPAISRLSTAQSFDSTSSSEDSSASNARSGAPSKLARERNRLTLRSYLHSLMANVHLANSPVLKSFLLSGNIRLTRDEMEDTDRREEADKIRDEGRIRFAREIAARVEGLREAVKSVKGDLMGKDGLTHVFATVKTTSNVRDLPENYQAVLEWARVSLASTVFQNYVASDNASESFAALKRIHGLMPYFLLKNALKVSNPIGMIRNVLDLFLAQPFGGRSLLQRMFTSTLSEEVKVLQEDIEAVKDKVEDAVMCEKVRQFVYAPKDIQSVLKADAVAENINILVVILRSSEAPVLNRPQMQRVARARRAHAAYIMERKALDDSDDDEGPQNDDAWLFEDLRVLAGLYSRLRDREQLIGLIFEGFTADLLKDIITIFYTPLAQVYRAASVADSLGDLQNFVNDLIKTVEQVEEPRVTIKVSQVDPNRTVNAFIQLIQRHEQAFYNFVHKVHSKGENLFDSLMRWVELFLTVVREGLGSPLSLEFLLPHMGEERAMVMQEVDAVALYHYKLKLVYEDKLRKRFGRVQGGMNGNDADAQDEVTQRLVDGIAREISFGELAKGNAADLAAEESDEESNGESSEYETDSEESTSEESGEDSPPILPAGAVIPAVAWTGSVAHQASSHPHHHRDGSVPQSTHRQATMPRRSRSVINLNEIHSKRPGDEPPLPALPPNLTSPSSKPLPLPPAFTPQTRLPLPRSRSVPPRSNKSKKKTTQEVLKPPDLHHIPALLPVFIEMMRPLLHPRQR